MLTMFHLEHRSRSVNGMESDTDEKTARKAWIE